MYNYAMIESVDLRLWCNQGGRSLGGLIAERGGDTRRCLQVFRCRIYKDENNNNENNEYGCQEATSWISDND